MVTTSPRQFADDDPVGAPRGRAAPGPSAGTQKTNSAMEYLLGGTGRRPPHQRAHPGGVRADGGGAGGRRAAARQPGRLGAQRAPRRQRPAGPPPPPAPTRPAVAATGAGGLLGVGGAAGLAVDAREDGPTAADALGIASGGASTAPAPVAAVGAAVCRQHGPAAADLLGGGGGVPTSAAAPTAGGATAAGFLSGLAGGPMDGRSKRRRRRRARRRSRCACRRATASRCRTTTGGWRDGVQGFTARAGGRSRRRTTMPESGQTVMPPEAVGDTPIRRIATKGAAGGAAPARGAPSRRAARGRASRRRRRVGRRAPLARRADARVRGVPVGEMLDPHAGKGRAATRTCTGGSRT